MINILFALFLLGAILFVAKKFYFPTVIAHEPEKYPMKITTRMPKKELSVILSNTQRWRKEGKISRDEYDHITDICLSEMESLKKPQDPEDSADN